MRCPDCNKFVSFEENDAEVDSLDVSSDGVVTATARIVNACGDCGQELKEATLDLEADHSSECGDHNGEGHDLSVEENGSERTSRSGYFKKGEFVPASGRYAKTLYGVEVGYKIECLCGELEIEGSMSDEVQASGMDELV